jgi:hypothetical protein
MGLRCSIFGHKYKTVAKRPAQLSGHRRRWREDWEEFEEEGMAHKDVCTRCGKVRLQHHSLMGVTKLNPNYFEEDAFEEREAGDEH